MTLQEALEMGRNMDFGPRSTMVGANQSVEDLPRDITRLFIRYGYTDELPDLSLFPCLEAFSSTLPVTMDYLAQQDLTKIKELYLRFENGAGAICILAPALETLSIAIDNNEDAQLDFFTCSENSIFLANMPHLKSLQFRQCTWHKVIINGVMPSVERLVFCNQDHTDFSILDKFPNLKELTVTGCGCKDVSFIKGLNNLTKLDVSYNYISDITPLLDIPSLQEVNIRRNTEQNNAHLLRDKGCKVIMNDADYSFEEFKRHLRIATWHAHLFIEQSRKHDSKRNPLYQKMLDTKPDEELFLWSFTKSVQHELESFDGASEKHIHFPVPKERLLFHVQEEYPFVKL